MGATGRLSVNWSGLATTPPPHRSATASNMSGARDATRTAWRPPEHVPITPTLPLLVGSDVRLHAAIADVGKPQDVDRLFDQVRQTFGRLDVLFNNAGHGAPGVAFEDLTFEQWQSVVDANLTGTFLCSQAAFRIMKDQQPQGGRIINNGSISAHTPRPNSAPYTATKHAITGLTKATALDGRKYDIACGQIDIGNAATDLANRMANGVPQANGEVRPEPLMEVEHVGDAVAFMAGLPLDTNVQ